MNEPNYIPASTLVQLGWTVEAIHRFLGQPDSVSQVDPAGSHVPCYELGRVEAAEASAPWKAWAQAQPPRHEGNPAAMPVRVRLRNWDNRRGINQVYRDAGLDNQGQGWTPDFRERLRTIQEEHRAKVDRGEWQL